jgi:DNA-binding IscR family transcriptional regulator
MKRDGRLSASLHALMHMSERGGPITSEELAICLCTNPVVVRRTMASLREAGLVRSTPGHGGGWTIAGDLEKVTLRDIYLALGDPPIFGSHDGAESPGCLLEQLVDHALDGAYRDAHATMMDRLAAVTLGRLAADFRKRHGAHHSKRKGRTQ